MQAVFSAGRLALLLQQKSCGIHAGAHPRRLGAIGKNMPQVGFAALALYFDAYDSAAMVFVFRDASRLNRLEEAGPSRSRVVLRFRTEQLGTAAHALVGSRNLAVVVLARESLFGSLLARDFVLVWSQFSAPLCIRLFDFVRHADNLQSLVRQKLAHQNPLKSDRFYDLELIDQGGPTGYERRLPCVPVGEVRWAK